MQEVEQQHRILPFFMKPKPMQVNEVTGWPSAGFFGAETAHRILIDSCGSLDDYYEGSRTIFVGQHSLLEVEVSCFP